MLQLVLLCLGATALSSSASFASNNEKVIRLPLKTKPLERNRRLVKGQKVIDQSGTNTKSGIDQIRYLLEGETENHKLEKQQIDALYQGYGVVYIDLWVGTPQPQRQTVIVGTGSPKTGFPCDGCTSCGELYHTDQYFQRNHSNSYRVSSTNCTCLYGHCTTDKQCILTTSYVEGSSWTGIESIDRTYAGGPHTQIQALPEVFSQHDKDDADPLRAQNFAFDHVFACITHSTGLFRTQMADGIMGMDNAPESFWSQAYAHGMIGRKAFSLCLAKPHSLKEVKKSGTEIGSLTMGGYDERLHTSPMVYCKLDQNTFFQLSLRNIYFVDNRNESTAETPRPLNVTAETFEKYESILVDSGTTDTYFPRGLAGPFRELWLEMVGTRYEHQSLTLTEEELTELPTILLQLEGHESLNKENFPDDPSQVHGLAAFVDSEHPYDVIVAIPPAHYMEKDDNGAYTARFYVDEFGFQATVGGNTMMGHDILFDVEEGALGFAESHCDYAQLEEEVAEEELKGEQGQKPEQGPPKSPKTPVATPTPAPQASAAGESGNTATTGSTSSSGRSGFSSSLLVILAACVVGCAAFFAHKQGWFGDVDRLHFGSMGRHQRIPIDANAELELQDVNSSVI